ncbi:uncharacterized protein FOBCDRAFT_286047 [Fusarium oxysporum Fo47]|uniref:Uncharacterized protein n=1 Tax=Fusarium oxysporum Fo47 TaxID=660027 RepID=W9JNV0_FUSOX|nr:uncharacterized protein FOBCDRAFT_286047 [Fusarium oxysporum Fo47]EWZ80874.1 hypothetical protein FOWG_15207 [Fusarium oxysporum f. sp. lycopersici MN25]KAJ4154288.1 hypothetical protein NW765_015037 [Fusarium oxysporum]EWZ31315.1 hypothetical protein FOZG_15720 [Fusarium oxysporum Fo47]KAJ4275824.1 hypothetical protein NW764_010324 [Fusarium oxysporum]QKD61404.1 hypothetical protein FOBCDRAFT_286047 [Fusarium oxysporum Fo47]
MPSFQNLPPEVTIAILKYLNPFDLLSVLQTFNKALYSAAEVAFRPYKEWTRNAQQMVALFPPRSIHSTRRLCPSYPSHIPPLDHDNVSMSEEIPRRDYESLSLELGAGPYIRCSPPDLITWMKLDGSFEWLEPLDEDMADEMLPHNGIEGDRPVAPKADVDALVKQVSDLGLVLPTGFEAFMRSDRLHQRIPSASAWYFRLSKLIKCPAAIDDDQGGYLIRFHFDQQSCAFAYLYLSKSGCHCVLVSTVNVPMCLNEDDEINGEQLDGDNEGEDIDEESIDTSELTKEYFSLAGLSFEEYLVTVYFEGLLSFQAESFEGLEDFVKHVYRSPREVEHLRETNEAIKVFLDAQKWKGVKHYRQLISD